MTGYTIILADPPWAYQNWTDAKNGAASSAMTTQGLPFLKTIPVQDWAAAAAILALWSTAPKLNEAMELGAHWGFEYVTKVPWLKTSPNTGKIRTGTGFWTRGAHEDLLIFRRGNPRSRRDRTQTPAGLLIGDRESPVFWSPPERQRHSSKPLGIHEWLTNQFEGPALELFARYQKPSWDCWGYDLGQELGAWGVRDRVVSEEPELACAGGQMVLFS